DGCAAALLSAATALPVVVAAITSSPRAGTRRARRPNVGERRRNGVIGTLPHVGESRLGPVGVPGYPPAGEVMVEARQRIGKHRPRRPPAPSQEAGAT